MLELIGVHLELTELSNGHGIKYYGNFQQDSLLADRPHLAAVGEMLTAD